MHYMADSKGSFRQKDYSLIKECEMNSNSRKYRNPIIELMCFFASLIVFFYHQNCYFGSGCLFMCSALNQVI